MAMSVLLVLAASVLTYWNSLNGGFVFDDHRAILSNDDLDPSKTSLWEIFQHDFWGGPMQRRESHKSYRPLTVLSYRYLNYYFKELEPYSYHLVNVALHALASALFLRVCEAVLGRRVWSTLAALLFAVHSAHTEAVANTVGRAEILSCIFFLLALLAYFKAISERSGRRMKPLRKERMHYVILSIALSACSMLSKEQGVMAIGVCGGIDLLLNWTAVWRYTGSWIGQSASLQVTSQVSNSDDNSGESGDDSGPKKARTSTSTNGRKTKARNKQSNSTVEHTADSTYALGFLRRLGILVVVGAVLLKLRFYMNHNSEPIFKPEELRASFHPNRTVRILSFSNIYSHNAWLLLAPSALCCDWSLGSVPLVTSLSDMRNVWSGILYCYLFALIIHTITSKRDRFAVGLALALTLLPFFPASGIPFKVGFVIAERVLYLPSMGTCLLVSIGMQRLAHVFHSLVWRRSIQIAMFGLVSVMALKSINRNQDWASDLSLFLSGVKVNPANVKLHNNLGMELKSAGRIEEARKAYLKAIDIEPDYAEVYFNYGNLLSDEGQYEEAAVSFEKAIESPQMYAKTLNNLATTYFRLSRWKEAEERFKESLKLSSDVATTYNNLASLYGETKRYEEAEEMFRKAMELQPSYTEAYFNLGTLLFQMGRIGEAEKNLKHALKLNPNHAGAANNLKVVEYHKAKKGYV